MFRTAREKEERVESKEMKWTILEPSSLEEDWTTGGEVPKPRSHHASIALNTNNSTGTKKVLICGGVCAKTNQLLKDCWTLDVIEKRWQRIGDLPRGAAWGHLIRYHGLIVHVGGGEFFWFGGKRFVGVVVFLLVVFLLLCRCRSRFVRKFNELDERTGKSESVRVGRGERDELD